MNNYQQADKTVKELEEMVEQLRQHDFPTDPVALMQDAVEIKHGSMAYLQWMIEVCTHIKNGRLVER